MENRILWAGLLAALLFVDARGATGAEPWLVADQPKLQQALENAPVLQTESLGEPARGVQPWLHDAVPNPDGKTWHVLQWYTWEDRGVVVSPLGGELRYNVTGPDGRIYGTDTAGEGKVGLYIYDPKLRKVAKYFGGVGPSHSIGSVISRGLAVDDTHAYVVSGDIPSYTWWARSSLPAGRCSSETTCIWRDLSSCGGSGTLFRRGNRRSM